MREINNFDETYTFCKALGSEIRISIIRLLQEHHEMNLNELSELLGVTNGAMTAHIKLLAEADIIEITHASGKRGSQKKCSLKERKFLINLANEKSMDNVYCADIPIGTYCNYSVYPTCGLATTHNIIGEFDDPRYFGAPERVNAGILWFTHGSIEYRIPNYLKQSQKLTELQFSFEISSEAPATCEEWPSDINFYINNIPLGYWTSPGDFGAVKGRYTPSWWAEYWNQYGLLKVLSVNTKGVFVDGAKISDVTIDQLDIDYRSDIIFKFTVPGTETHPGCGMTLFGTGFGNYNQDIKLKASFTDR